MALAWMITSLVLLGIAPGSRGNASAVIRERVDLIELNHFVDEDGREVFRQVIFYDWSKTHHRFHVRAWRLVKSESQVPIRRWNPDRYQCTWHDDGLLRQVWAPKLRETWTQRDPERVNRALLPEDQRVPLFVPKLAKEKEEISVK
jgi:hypothetical protein